MASPSGTVYTPPKTPHGHHHKPPATGGTKTGGDSTQTGSSSTNSGTSQANAYAKAQAQAKAQQHKDDVATSQRYLQDAKDLNGQIRALRGMLSSEGFRQALEIKLGNLDRSLRRDDRHLMAGYRARFGSLVGAATDNEKSADAQSYANLSNKGRERANALSEAFANGAGESDVLAAQQMALHNWNANQSEISRSFFDTQRSVNSSLTDLNRDTADARLSRYNQDSANRDLLWTNYYDRKNDTYTQLGNTLGQKAEFLGLANEAIASKKTRAKQHDAAAGAAQAFHGAKVGSGKAWRDPGPPAKIQNWEGRPQFDGYLSDNSRGATLTTLAPAKPEGATLRKWET
jgi:hypothetical protein